MEAFESLRDKHVLLVNEKIVSPTIESRKTKSPKYDNWMDFLVVRLALVFMKR